jgi:hypothetical protein
MDREVAWEPKRLAGNRRNGLDARTTVEHELRGRATAALFADRPVHIHFAIYNRLSFISSPSSVVGHFSMSSLSLPSDTDNEGKSPTWRH